MRRFRRQRRRPAPTTDRRTPEQRLEAMIGEKNEDRRWRMFVRIRDDLDATQEVPAWLNGLSTLRDRLVASNDETYFLAEILAESALFGEHVDAELKRLVDALKAIEAADGLADDESYFTDDAPEDWLEVNRAWDARANQVMAESMRKAGLGDVAKAFIEERAKFDERASDGRQRILPDSGDDAEFD